MNGPIPTEALPKPKSGRDLLADAEPGRLPGSAGVTVLLVILALLAGFIGFSLLTQATMGVGIICEGCLLAVLARIAQASYMHLQVVHFWNRP